MRVVRPVLLTAVLSIVLASAAQAAPVAMLKQFKVPTANSGPRAITNGSDGNRWFTESSANLPAKIGRITPAGVVTEFGTPLEPVCNGCILTDIVQGPDNVLYFTSNDPFLGRITTSGTVLAPVALPESNALGGNITAHLNQIWISDFNNDSLWRYDIPSAAFTQFPVPEPSDVAVDNAGRVWFATPDVAPGIGRLDPGTGVSTVTPTQGSPRELTIAPNGNVWFTERFVPQAVGRLVPSTNTVTEFPVTNVGPEGIAAALDGSIWFTQVTKGNIASITDAGVITEGKAVKGSEPFGITVDAAGNPWYTMMAANKIGEYQLR